MVSVTVSVSVNKEISKNSVTAALETKPEGGGQDEQNQERGRTGSFQKGHNLTLSTYKISKKFPPEEKFGLAPQMRRAAASICTNLMEGSHRLGKKEFRQFVGIAKGSAGELKYHLLLAKDLGYLPQDQFATMRSEAEEISMMLNGLAKSLSDTDTDTDTK